MKKTAIKKIAIRIPNWIGDALLSTPFIRYTAKYFPNAKIYLIFRKSVEPLFKIKDYQAEHIVIDDKQDGLIKTGSFLREFKFDLYFNLPESISSIVLAFLSRARIKAGYRGETLGLLLNFRLRKPKNVIPRALKYFRILSIFLKKYKNEDMNELEKDFIKNARSELLLDKEEIERGETILNEYKLKNKIIGINPNCSAETRRWPGERFARLADLLINRYNGGVIFFGNSDEKEYVYYIVSIMDNKPVNLTGKTNLREYIAVLKLIDLFITNDSGPMHLANSMGTDVIALEGPADVLETGMLNPDSRRIYIDKKLSCSPCVKNKCRKDIECMRAISVDDVLNEVKNLPDF